ncbi:MAG: VOC family protein [Gemmatimonadota bacterium]|nr:VOC family protein [Gemmatimonadota bacterium]
MSETPLGRFCWFDLMTLRPDEAPDFYGPVTGWGTMPFEGGEEPYLMWTNGEAPIGGMMELSAEAIAAGAPPHWLAYISTPDVGGTATLATKLGGSVMSEVDVPTVGSFAVVSDRDGAVFAAFQPIESTPGHDGVPDVGEFSWHELYTEDWESAFDFYSRLFGWVKTDQMDMGERGIYQMFGREGQTLGGMMNRDPDMPPPMWMYYVRVADIEAAAATVKDGGGSVWNGPMEVPGGDLVAHCTDPQGATFALHSTAAPGAGLA